jgi:phosphatidylinositol-3-phosphatase
VAALSAAAKSRTPHVIHGPFGTEFQVPQFETPTRRASAAAILGMLAFGVALGAANIGFAGSPFTLFFNNPQNAAQVTPAASTPQGGSGGGGGGGNSSPNGSSPTSGDQTQTQQTSTQPPSGGSKTGTTTTSPPPSTGLPPVRHVFLITLSDQSYFQTFEAGTGDTYLNSVAKDFGEVVPDYFSATSGNLASNIATLSGQGPTPQTLQNCPTYANFKLKKVKKGAKNPGGDGELLGNGCVYPSSTPTIMSQLKKAGFTSEAFVQGQGTKLKSVPHSAERRAGSGSTITAWAQKIADELHLRTPHSEHHIATDKVHSNAAKNTSELAASCRHPDAGQKDPFYKGTTGYATWTNPLMYFASVTGSKNCAKEDVGIGQLASDLRSVNTTPNLSLIYADPCDDGNNTPCKAGNKQAGLAASDTFLRSILDKIIESPAYKQDGLIIITFDQAAQHGADSGKYFSKLSLTGTPTYPNLGAKHGAAVRIAADRGAVSTVGTTTASTPSTTPATTTTGTTTGTTTTPCTTSTTTGTTATAPSTTASSTTAPSTTATGTTTTGTTSTTGTPCPQSPPDCYTLAQCSLTGGGGQVGMLAISQWIKPGSIDITDLANNYSLLFELEDLFGVGSTIGYATDTLQTSERTGAAPFATLFNNYKAPSS